MGDEQAGSDGGSLAPGGRPRFAISAWVLMAAGVAGMAYIAARMLQPEGVARASMSYYVGEGVGLLLSPVLFGYVGYRVAGRSNRVATIVATVVLMLGAGVRLAGLQNDRDREAREVRASIRAEADRVRQSSAAGDGKQAMAASEGVQGELRKAAELAGGDEKAAILVQSEVLKLLQDATAQSSSAVDAFTEAGGRTASTATSIEIIDHRLALLTAAEQANTKVDGLLRTMATKIDEGMRARGVSGTVRESVLAGFRSGYEGKAGFALEVRACEGEILAQSRLVLELLKKHFGHFKSEDGKVSFDDETGDAAARFNACVAAISAAVTREGEAQKQLAAQK